MDTVKRTTFEQVMWERDMAIDQLKQLGYGLGEKPDPYKNIREFALWLSDRDYLNRIVIDYDYYENPSENVFSLSSEEVISEYKEYLNDRRRGKNFI